MTDFKAKMHQIRFRLPSSAPDPAGGAYSAPPDPLAGFGGPTSKEREREGGKGKRGEGRVGEGMKGKGRGGEGKGRHEPPPHYLEEVYAYGCSNSKDAVFYFSYGLI